MCSKTYIYINKAKEVHGDKYNYIEIWENDWLLFIKKIKILQKLWKSKFIDI